MRVILTITEPQAKTIIDATAFLSDDDPLKLSIVTAIAFARRLEAIETQGVQKHNVLPGNIPAVQPGHYTVLREE